MYLPVFWRKGVPEVGILDQSGRGVLRKSLGEQSEMLQAEGIMCASPGDWWVPQGGTWGLEPSGQGGSREQARSCQARTHCKGAGFYVRILKRGRTCSKSLTGFRICLFVQKQEYRHREENQRESYFKAKMIIWHRQENGGQNCFHFSILYVIILGALSLEINIQIIINQGHSPEQQV